MNALGASVVPFIVFGLLQVAIGGRGTEAEQSPTVQLNKIFSDRAVQNILRQAGEFLGNLTAAKNASANLARNWTNFGRP